MQDKLHDERRLQGRSRVRHVSGKGTCSASGATCVGGFSAKATDGTVTYCNGYKCIDGSGCTADCTASADCDTSQGYACTGAVRAGDGGERG